ncbi:MAG TPA: hypothetical protein VL916_15075, partial [Ilumatobacteraceae bacterium]|nr:hypothetical protein [Ilumatobacteraceae bacterium]
MQWVALVVPSLPPIVADNDGNANRHTKIPSNYELRTLAEGVAELGWGGAAALGGVVARRLVDGV